MVGESLADDARRSGTVDRFLAELDGMARPPTAAVAPRAREHPLMEASSRAALVQVRERLDELTREPSGLLERTQDRLTRQPRAATAEELLGLADELFAVARLLDGQLTLRRALSDPAGKPDERAALARRLLRRRSCRRPRSTSSRPWPGSAGRVRSTWSRRSMTLAHRGGAGRRRRPRASSTASRTSCSGSAASSAATASWPASSATARRPAEGKAALLDRLLSGKVSPVTEQLLRNVLTGPHVGTRRERRSSGSPRWPAAVAGSRSPG